MPEEHELRKAQEGIYRIIEGGFNKELAKLTKNVYDCFIKEGFDKVQALDLTKALIFKNANS